MTNQSWLSPYGYLAVDLFFVLSGFVIGVMYERKLVAGLGFWPYLLGIRVVRMYPMILLGAFLGLLAAPVSVIHVGRPLVAFVKGLLLTPYLHGSDFFVLNPVMWSLVLELLANGVHAAVFRLLSGRLLTAVVALRAVLVVAASYHYYNLDIGRGMPTAFGGVARVTFSFFLGLLIFRNYSVGKLPVVRIAFGFMLVLAVLLMVVPLPTLNHHIPMLHDLAAVFFVFPLTVIVGVQSNFGERAKVITSKLEGFSYPLYAIHFPLIQIAIYAFSFGLAGQFLRGASWVAFCLAVIVLASVVDVWIEEPFERWWKARRGRLIKRRAL